jgi:hypothetical protein
MVLGLALAACSGGEGEYCDDGPERRFLCDSPYECIGGACRKRCTKNEQCDDDQYCIDGVCGVPR